MKRHLILLIFIPLSLFAQENSDGWMQPDRPGMATGTGIMPFKAVMWETGFQCDWADAHSITLPTTMFRFGITQFAELRLEYDGALAETTSKHFEYEVAPLIIGTKIRVFDGSDTYKWIPQVALMANLAIPSTKELAETMHVAPSIYALFNNDVTDWFSIGYNVGAEWDGYSAIPATFLAVCLGFNITDNLGAFVESYNYITKYGMRNTQGEANIDFGFNWMVHPKVQLDIYAGFNCQDPTTYSMVGFGVAWRIN